MVSRSKLSLLYVSCLNSVNSLTPNISKAIVCHGNYSESAWLHVFITAASAGPAVFHLFDPLEHFIVVDSVIERALETLDRIIAALPFQIVLLVDLQLLIIIY